MNYGLFKKRWFVIVIFIIVLANIPPIKHVFRLVFDEYHYRYSNESGSFTFVEFKLRDAAMMNRKFSNYKAFPQARDTIIYRLFKRNLLSFWRWGEYIYDKRYKMPFKSWRNIRQLRGYDFKYLTHWQDF